MTEATAEEPPAVVETEEQPVQTVTIDEDAEEQPAEAVAEEPANAVEVSAFRSLLSTFVHLSARSPVRDVERGVLERGIGLLRRKRTALPHPRGTGPLHR